MWQTELLLLPTRLHRARRDLGLTQEEVAERAGLARNTVSRYELGNQVPSGRVLIRLAAIYDKPVEWFYDGEEAKESVSPNAEPPEPATNSVGGGIVSLAEVQRTFSARFDRLESYVRSAVAETRSDYDAGRQSPLRDPVDLNEVATAAGGGAEVWDETVVGKVWFRRDWLDRHAIDPKQCNVITVRGESMEPILPDGCSILVDRSQGRKRRREGRIFVLRTEYGLVVRRAGRDEEGNWQTVSEHPSYPPVPWTDTTETIGEVRWAARMF